MERVGNGYYETEVSRVEPGALYCYRLNDSVERPDPASRFQPQGIHGPSQVTRPEFGWTDSLWRGRAWDDYVIYEAHVGTFTTAGTFVAMIDQLDSLARLGVTALELMPVAQFPGDRNWGYDGVHPYAPQNSYGGPEGLKVLVDACHARSLAVVLDVVYNHLGPEGNYLQEFGPYFTDRVRTPWGPAVNFDGPHSDAVRDFFIGNAVYWINEFHIDGLRLDATHAIFDRSARPLLSELANAVHARGQQLGRRVVVIAENNANDPRIVRASERGGYGLDSQLLDDFQRSLHALVTGERAGYYGDFGGVADFAKATGAGFVLTGQYSQYRHRRWGANASDLPANRFVAYAQSHDTVGNRPNGDRLGRLVGFEELKLAAAATILSPSIPFLFMGEEYDEPAGFHYFISHIDPALAASVCEGRAREFAAFHWPSAPSDPQSPETFQRSRLTRFAAHHGHHGVLWSFYQELLRLRKQLPAIREPSRAQATINVAEDQKIIVATRQAEGRQVCTCFHFGDQGTTIDLPPPIAGRWTLLLDSADERWQGPNRRANATNHPAARLALSPNSCVLLSAEDPDT
jgi:maltooligosyltrehalose trehalohydrolase